MNDTVLTAERVLEAAEDVLRRFGPDKTTVVDVARALGVSHGSVYRHFPSKVALRDAVAAAWLARLTAPLAPILAGRGPAAERLKRWLDTLIAIKREKSRSDPELFATYHRLVEQSREVVRAHVDHLLDDITRIVGEGMETGEFAHGDPRRVALGVLASTARFLNPVHAAEWSDPEIDEAYAAVWALILRGLRATPD